MSEVAFATYGGQPEMCADDGLTANILRENGVDVGSVVWDAPDVNWSQFDLVVIRSTWDYHLKTRQYVEWLRSFPPAHRRLWNPPDAVLGNLNKRYLTALAAKGVAIVPTRYQTATGELVLREVLESCRYDEVVIKPAISAGAHQTWRTTLARAEADQAKFAGQVRRQDILIQPYLPEIAAQGEWSLVFFGGEYSHATLKRPADGDFRVQWQHGGQTIAAEPAAHIVAQAQAILAHIPHDLLYARVDGIERAGQFLLMELEINEPFLFVGLSARGAQRFAEAIMRRLRLLKK